MDIFNSRELATFLWIAALLVWGLSRASVRVSMLSVVKAILVRPIITIFILAYIYIATGVWILHRFGFWDSSTLKDSIMWSLTAASITLFNINKVKENKKYFEKALKDNIKFALILEFITGLYTFSLITELILLPIMALIGMLLAVAETDAKHQQVKKLLTWIVSLIGLLTIVYCISKTIEGFKDFATVENLINFFLPIILAIWFLPFIFLLSFYMDYQTNFVVLGNAIKEPGLLRYANKQAVLNFKFDRKGFDRWKSSLFSKNIQTKNDILQSIAVIKERQEIEANPPEINSLLGWSPFQAKDFLLPLNVETDYYQNSYDDKWFAISKPIKLSGDWKGDSVSYSILGGQEIASELVLDLTHYKTYQQNNSNGILLKYAICLFKAATQNDLPIQVQDAISKGTSKAFYLENIKVEVKKEKWPTDLGYSINFSIKRV